MTAETKLDSDKGQSAGANKSGAHQLSPAPLSISIQAAPAGILADFAFPIKVKEPGCRDVSISSSPILSDLCLIIVDVPQFLNTQNIVDCLNHLVTSPYFDTPQFLRIFLGHKLTGYFEDDGWKYRSLIKFLQGIFDSRVNEASKTQP